MTNSSVLQPGYWRQRAAEAREGAKGIVHPANRKILEDVAISYEEMADLMEKHQRSTVPARRIAPAAARPPANPRQRPVPPARTCSSIQR